MFPKLLVVLPVADLDRSSAFYRALGYPISRDPADGAAVCVAINESVRVVLQTRERAATIAVHEIVDPRSGVEAIFVFALETRKRVDEFVDRALAAGGSPAGTGVTRENFFRRGFLDPDGHQFAAVSAAAPPTEIGSPALDSLSRPDASGSQGAGR
jgi:predicted lactoylglutathione lyase